MSIQSRLKQNLFASVSFLALGLAPSGVFAAAVNLSTNPSTGATNNDGYVLNANFTLASGTLADAGTATTDLVLMNNATAYNIVVSSGATIQMTNNAGAIGKFAIKANGANAASTIVNNGNIKNLRSTGDAIAVYSNLASVTNSSTGYIETYNGYGVYTNNATLSSLTNNGTIVELNGGSTISIGAGNTGGITTFTNNNLIQGTHGNTLSFEGANTTNTINNGTIEGTSGAYSIQVEGAVTGSIQNNSTGILRSANNTAIRLHESISGGIINSGTIRALAAGGVSAILMDASKTAAITNNTGGLITSLGTQATIYDSGTITHSGAISNDGTISNTRVAALGDAISVSTLANGLSNTNIISSTATGAAAAIRVTAVSANGIVNTGGTITSYGTDGTIKLVGDNDILGDITNTGTIQSLHATAANRVAIDLSSQTTVGKAIAVINSGTITGQVKLGAADIFTQNAGSTTVTSGTAILGTAGGNETLNLNAGSIAGNIDLGGTASDTINFGSASGNTYTTGGTIGAGIIDVKFGTVNIGHAVTLAGATKTITVRDGATMDFTSSQTHTASTITSHGTIKVDAGITATTASAVVIDGGTLKIAATSDTNYGKLIGSGITLSNNGSIYIDAASLGNGLVGKTLAIFQGTTSAVSGIANGTLMTDNNSVYKFTTQISGNDINALIGYANTLASSATSTGSTPAAAALDSVTVGANTALDAIISTISSYNTDEQKEAAIKTLAPDNSGAASQAAVAMQDMAVGTIESHMETARADINGTTVATGGAGYNRAIWGKGFGSIISQTQREGVDGYDAKIGGVELGADTAIKDNARIGVAYAYGQSNAKGINSKSQVNTHQLAVYGTCDVASMYYEATGAVAFNSYDAHRTLFDNSVASGDYNGNQYTLKGSSGYRINLRDNLMLTPFASLQYSLITQEDYTETGSNANLTVDNKDLSILKSGLGVKFSNNINVGGVIYTPRLSVAWHYDFIGDVAESSSSFASGTAFTNQGASAPRHTFKVGTGLDIFSHDSLTVSMDYNFEVKQNFNSHSGTINIRKAF